jgi:hypothetical protein
MRSSSFSEMDPAADGAETNTTTRTRTEGRIASLQEARYLKVDQRLPEPLTGVCAWLRRASMAWLLSRWLDRGCCALERLGMGLWGLGPRNPIKSITAFS